MSTLNSTNSSSAALAASKQGTLIPNRIFIGGLPSNTVEHELKAFFSTYGQVKDVKIINDRSGLSKGVYGFITFESQEVAEKIIETECETLVFKDRKLNVGHAIRKQPSFPRPDVSTQMIFANTSVPYTFPNGVTMYPVSGQDLPFLTQSCSYAANPMMIGQAPMFLSQPSIAYQPTQTAMGQTVVPQGLESCWPNVTNGAMAASPAMTTSSFANTVSSQASAGWKWPPSNTVQTTQGATLMAPQTIMYNTFPTNGGRDMVYFQQQPNGPTFAANGMNGDCMMMETCFESRQSPRNTLFDSGAYPLNMMEQPMFLTHATTSGGAPVLCAQNAGGLFGSNPNKGFTRVLPQGLGSSLRDDTIPV